MFVTFVTCFLVVRAYPRLPVRAISTRLPASFMILSFIVFSSPWAVAR
jgi:hypothetical protein